ncbi:MAG TPA: RDD family protein [Steroidobacteraceae bacterium]|nr:RDD family protein [Steroidobacteraceae bacterium]
MNADALVVSSPTGVDVELAIAGPGSRAYAFLIDWHIRLLVALGWLAAFAIAVRVFHWRGGSSTTVAFLLSFFPALLIYFLYHPVLELAMRGRTPGKRMAGVRIVDRQGGTPSSLALLIRNAFRLIDCLPAFYGVGLAITIFSAQRVRLGDLAAGTLLVHDGDRESRALSQLGALSLNPSLDAATLALGNDLLLRWQELESLTRRRLAHQLLSRIAPAATPPGPRADTLDDAQLRQQLRDALSGGPR